MITLRNYIEEGITFEWGKYKDIFFLESESVFKESEYEYSFSCLDEGLIKSYDTIKTIQYVIKQLKSKKLLVPDSLKVEYNKLMKQNEKESISNHIKFFIEQNGFSEDLMDEIINSFKFCGYYLVSHFSRRENKQSLKVVEVLQFSPRFGKNIVQNLPDKIYHISNIDNLEILKPKNKSVLGINYPPRLYFFTIYNIDLFKSFIRTSRKDIKENEFFVYEIDTSKIDLKTNKKKVDFFIDYDYEINGKSSSKCIYTYEPLRKECLVKKEIIKN